APSGSWSGRRRKSTLGKRSCALPAVRRRSYALFLATSGTDRSSGNVAPESRRPKARDGERQEGYELAASLILVPSVAAADVTLPARAAGGSRSTAIRVACEELVQVGFEGYGRIA